MAARPSPDETATLILDAVVEGRYGMRPGNVLGVMAIRARASNHDVHLDDFGPGLVRASENGWFEQTGPHSYRLTEAGFAAASQPPASDQQVEVAPANAAGNAHVSSEGQAGGITAQNVTIMGAVSMGPVSPPSAPLAQTFSWFDSWWTRIGIGAGIVAAIFAVLDHYEKHHSADPPTAVEAPQNSQAQPHPQQIVAPPLPRAHEQPSSLPAQVNVSSQNQSGGIIAGTVNVYGSKAQRHLNQQSMDFLVLHIPKSAKVTVTAVMGDGEAFLYAKEITDWLHSQGWTNVQGVNQAIFSGPVFGQGINPNKAGGFDIVIGTQR